MPSQSNERTQMYQYPQNLAQRNKSVAWTNLQVTPYSEEGCPLGLPSEQVAK